MRVHDNALDPGEATFVWFWGHTHERWLSCDACHADQAYDDKAAIHQCENCRRWLVMRID